MNSYSEVRRVRQEMSEAVSHDVRALIAEINKRRSSVAVRIIDPGTKAEQSDAQESADPAFSTGESSPAAGCSPALGTLIGHLVIVGGSG